ncbi:hypothetical protein ACIOHC_36250 [Streptomyces sp. NPDC088252]|uniref:hypothetical protein n=1 Tax=Streptomyces sp. NPDC088252 TaxID=3365845 RepID=UPI00382ABB28
MHSSTGAARHDDMRDADYSVNTEESSVASTWCVACVLEYIECGMGGCLQFVTKIRAVDGPEHQRLVRELETLGVKLDQS